MVPSLHPSWLAVKCAEKAANFKACPCQRSIDEVPTNPKTIRHIIFQPSSTNRQAISRSILVPVQLMHPVPLSIPQRQTLSRATPFSHTSNITRIHQGHTNSTTPSTPRNHGYARGGISLATIIKPHSSNIFMPCDQDSGGQKYILLRINYIHLCTRCAVSMTCPSVSMHSVNPFLNVYPPCSSL